MSSNQTLAIFIWLLPLALLSHGCGRNADLVAIQEFSALANQAAEQFPNIANDMYASCVRSAEYQPISLDNTTTPSENDGAASAVSAVFGDRTQALQDCENSRAIGNGLIATHAVLTTYLTSLGQLASDRTINLENINALQSSLQNSPIEGLNQVASAEIRTSRDHGIRVLDLLGGALCSIQNRSRTRVIQQVVVETDTQFGALVDTIAQIIEGNYLRKLRFEENAIDEYYRTYMEALVRERTAGDTQSLTATILGVA